jgi:hypothetical protein
MKIRLLLVLVSLVRINTIYAQDSTKEKSLEIYGFAMTDFGYNFDQINPAWFDALRVTKLPVSKNQFGTNGNTYFSVRQTRFGVKGYKSRHLVKCQQFLTSDLWRWRR